MKFNKICRGKSPEKTKQLVMSSCNGAASTARTILIGGFICSLVFHGNQASVTTLTTALTAGGEKATKPTTMQPY